MTRNFSNNCGLILEQKSLHHVSVVAIRNLSLQLPHTIEGCKNVFLYFTMHSQEIDQSTKELFKSAKTDFCYNPTWYNVQLSNFNSIKVAEFLLRLWIGTNENHNIVKEWNVSLSALNCCGNSLCNEKLRFHENAVVFQLHQMFYCSSSSIALLSDVSFWKLRLDNFEPKLSYDLCTLQKYLLFTTSTTLCKKRVKLFSNDIKKLMIQHKKLKFLKSELETLRERIALIKGLVRRENVLLANEKNQLTSLNETLCAKEKQRKENEDQLTEERQRVRSCNELCIDTKLDTSRKFKHLALRRRDILTELSDIFPIAVVQADRDSKSNKTPTVTVVHTICNVKLPESESFSQREDLPTSVALGYTAQLISMMSQFMLVPLRYSVVQKGSLSSVVDHVTEKLSERERIFPLYVKSNKDRFITEYGVFLLNKNVAQLRYYCGLGTSNLKTTLKNIKSLLEERLGATSNFVGSNPSKPIAIVDSHRKNIYSTNSLDDMIMKSSTARLGSSSDADYPGPSSGYKRRFSPSQSKRQTNNETKSVSPRRVNQRTYNRHQDLQSLRGELLGLNDCSNPPRKSPETNQVRKVDISDNSLPTPAGSRSTSASFKASLDLESIESISRGDSNRALTGLEEIDRPENDRNAKLPLASARAELMGKLAARQNRDTASLWSRGPVSSSYVRKRGELFRKQNPPDDNRVDDDRSSCQSSESPSGSSDTAAAFDSNTRLRVESDERPSVEVLQMIEPDVLVLDPSKHAIADVQSDDELDLC